MKRYFRAKTIQILESGILLKVCGSHGTEVWVEPDFAITVSQYNMETVDKRLIPRMPWHDVHTAMVILSHRIERVILAS